MHEKTQAEIEELKRRGKIADLVCTLLMLAGLMSACLTFLSKYLDAVSFSEMVVLVGATSGPLFVLSMLSKMREEAFSRESRWLNRLYDQEFFEPETLAKRLVRAGYGD